MSNVTSSFRGPAGLVIARETIDLLNEREIPTTPANYEINDTWGHLVGDQVLRFIASVLRQHASGDFLAARYGGEEFAIVIPRTTLAQAQMVAAGVQHSVRSKLLKRKSTGETLSRVTLSFGIAQLRVHEGVNEPIERADACLYASKRGGRDRITTDEELDRLEAA